MTEKMDCVVLDRIEPGWTPPYCTHGRATCVGCAEWVWLGDKTHEAVASRAVAPLCKQCAARYVPKGCRPDAHINDHLRADGPHG